MVALRGLSERGEAPRRGPVELPAVDHDAAKRRPVSANPLCCAVHDDVCPVLDWADQIT